MSEPGALYGVVKDPLLKRVIKYLKRQGNEFAADPAGYLESSARAALPPDPLGGYNAQGVPQMNPEATKWLADNVGFGAMTVYHGSPHVFDKFDMSKLGTGEGAQAYGHGLYFAESPEVARQYQEELSKRISVDGKSILNNNKIVGSTGNQNVDDFLIANNGNLDAAIKDAMDGFPEIADQLQLLKGKVDSVDGGAFYKVDIPDEAVDRMIDLNAPMSQQPKALIDYLLGSDLSYLPKARTRRTLEAYIEQTKAGRAGPISNMPEPDGQMIHSALTDFGTDTARSEALTRAMRDAGIPGIKYFDGQSRAGAEGTRNFVLFDDRLPRILERNGVPTGNKPWEKGEMDRLIKALKQ